MDGRHNLFHVEERFHENIEQIYEGLVVFVVAPWENGLPEPEYDDGYIYIYIYIYIYKIRC